MELLCDYKR